MNTEVAIDKDLISKGSIAHFTHDGLLYYLHSTLEHCAGAWDEFCKGDLYYNSSYLLVIELSASLNITPYYLIGVDANYDICSVFYYQVDRFDLEQSLKGNPKRPIYNKLISKYVKFDVLINGNLLLTGRYGYLDKKSRSEIKISSLQTINDYAFTHIKAHSGKNLQGVLMKDFLTEHVQNQPLSNKYGRYVVQPNMVLNLDPNCRTMSDFIGTYKAKYRTRYHRARKKAKELVQQELDYEFLLQNQHLTHQLYMNISGNVAFNLFTLDTDYFANIKKAFGKDLKVLGYFRDNVLIGFSTCLINHDHLDAHFLGYDLQVNHDHQLYLNMLYDMVELGIAHGLDRVNMSRTAIEIKSSVGAVNQTMVIFFRHQNSLLNTLTKPIFNRVKPDMSFEIRSPFKDENEG